MPRPPMHEATSATTPPTVHSSAISVCTSPDSIVMATIGTMARVFCTRAFECQAGCCACCGTLWKSLCSALGIASACATIDESRALLAIVRGICE